LKKKFLYRSLSKLYNSGQKDNDRVTQLEEKLWSYFGEIASIELRDLLVGNSTPIDKNNIIELLVRYFIKNRNASKAIELVNIISFKSVKSGSAGKKLRSTIMSLCIVKFDTNQGNCYIRNWQQLQEEFRDSIFHKINYISHFKGNKLKNSEYCIKKILNKRFKDNKLIEIYSGISNKVDVFHSLSSKKPPLIVPLEPKVTIVVSTFNSSETIRYILASIQNQTWINIEVIIVDDHSSDSTVKIIKEIAINDNRLHLLQHPENQGTYAARNFALLHATGKYFTVNDSDDWSHPQRIQLQVEALEADQKILGVMTFRVRVDESLTFLPRFDLPGSPILHNDYSSLMVSTSLAKTLGGWDPVRCSADAEFVDRIKHHYGPDRIKKIYPEVPLSFSLYTESNLTGTSPRGILSKFYGSRKEYMDAAHHWQKTGGKVISRTSQVNPFPVPSFLYFDKPDIIQFDIVLVSDFRLTGGTNHCNFEYLREFSVLGYKVGLFHWPRYDVSLNPNRNPIIQQAMQDYGIIPIVWGDRVKVKLLLFHHPPVLNWTPDKLPEFYPEKVGLLVNQSAQELIGGPENMYSVEKVNQKLVDLYGKNPEWIPISPTIRDLLADHPTSLKLSAHDWLPLVDLEKWGREPVYRNHDRKLPIIGRHSRDHWAKWPKQKRAFDQAYCGNKKVKVQLMGGSRYPSETFLRFPRNWQFFDFNHTPGPQFVQNLDFFVNYIHEQAIEAFGRNVAEAMASGVPVLCSPQYKNCFGDAALYPEPEDVYATIQELWNNQELYLNQAQKGRAFVLNDCTPETLQKHIQEYLPVKV